MDRERYPRRGGGFRVADYQWENPMPDISAADAKMWLALKGWGVRFHYRLPVVGWTNPPVFLRTLLPDWAPEFYLPFQRTVIVILGDFFGTIPAVIDATALGKAILEQAGWKVRVINEFELNYKGAGKILAEMHVTAGGANAGRVLHNPYGVPDTMAKFRRMRETSMRYLSTNVRVRHGPALGRRRSLPPGERQRIRRVGRGFPVRRSYRRRAPYSPGGRRERT